MGLNVKITISVLNMQSINPYNKVENSVMMQNDSGDFTISS